MSRFDRFKLAVPGVRNAHDLCTLICEVGLRHDPRGLYDEYGDHQLPEGHPGGAWQHPMELSTFLWEGQDVFRTMGVRSYLDVGTFTGYTFFIIREFLRAHVCPELRAKTVDPFDYVHDPELRPHVEADMQQCTAQQVAAAGERYDFVLVDGLHQAPGPTDDFETVRGWARLVAFHDIADRFCPDVVAAFQHYSTQDPGVERAWRFTHSKCGNFGIGLLQLRSLLPHADAGAV
jgi:hypothetical protein